MVKKEKDILHRELQRKVDPTSKLDFALLFNELETWRKQEVTRIKVRTVLSCVILRTSMPYVYTLSAGDHSEGGGETCSHVRAACQ